MTEANGSSLKIRDLILLFLTNALVRTRILGYSSLIISKSEDWK